MADVTIGLGLIGILNRPLLIYKAFTLNQLITSHNYFSVLFRYLLPLVYM